MAQTPYTPGTGPDPLRNINVPPADANLPEEDDPSVRSWVAPLVATAIIFAIVIIIGFEFFR